MATSADQNILRESPCRQQKRLQFPHRIWIWPQARLLETLRSQQFKGPQAYKAAGLYCPPPLTPLAPREQPGVGAKMGPT